MKLRLRLADAWWRARRKRPAVGRLGLGLAQWRKPGGNAHDRRKAWRQFLRDPSRHVLVEIGRRD